MKNLLRLALLSLPCLIATGSPDAGNIQRTLSALEASTETTPAQVRVLFYGQSITAQNWTRVVEHSLKERYPSAEITFRNAAIGGYTSPLLVRTAEHDLYPWYPDLMFFHVYGPIEQYEEIIAQTRKRTTAEIVLWTSHVNAPRDLKTDQATAPADARAEHIKAVAERYDCMLIDLREAWYQHLKANQLAVPDLLKDGVHLNPAGCEVYGAIISEALVRIPGSTGIPASCGSITTIPLTDASVRQGPEGELTLSFTGNRVVAVSDGSGGVDSRAPVLLDGKPLSQTPAAWAITRPSKGPAGIWMPAINRIGFEGVPEAESWTLTCLRDSAPDGSKIHFKVHGSVTGDDGEGWSTERFVSPSKRVIIEPADWRIFWTLGYRKATLPEGFQVTWETTPMFADALTSTPAGTRTLLVQGISNGPHTLTLLPKNGLPGIKFFQVHAPASLNP